jgi:hypothetical protein
MSRELRKELEALQVRRRRLARGGDDVGGEVTTSLYAEISTLRERRRELEVERFQRPTTGLGASPPAPRRRPTRPVRKVNLLLLAVRAFGLGLVVAGVGTWVAGHGSPVAIVTAELWAAALVYSLWRPRWSRGS